MPTLYLFLHGRDPCISPTSRVYLAYISEQEDHISPVSPHISPISPYISGGPHDLLLPISPYISLYLPISPHISEQEDHMTSFFLAETLKYLYLLFDEAS